ncbi:MAG: hypothetical protein LBH90_03055 [Tannerella sp.]|nr:hypothetical protein [Tannerella sp.]
MVENTDTIPLCPVPSGRAPAYKTAKGSIPVSTFGRNPRSTRRSGFPLQVLLLPAVVVRALRSNPLRKARRSPFRSLTGIHHKRSLFEMAALQT